MSGSDPASFELIRFQALTRQDLPLLCSWIQLPHVAQWWYPPCTLAEVEADYLPSIEGHSTTKPYLVYLGCEPIGFIQSYVVMDSGDGWWVGETDPGARGIDQFIADPSRVNAGLGTAMIRAFVSVLFQDPEVTKVQTDPSPDNARAIRCYTKAGFRSFGQITTPDGPALFMLRDRSDPCDAILSCGPSKG
jgi:RimJ/RimL family protein N-acetyltransferase